MQHQVWELLFLTEVKAFGGWFLLFRLNVFLRDVVVVIVSGNGGVRIDGVEWRVSFEGVGVRGEAFPVHLLALE